MIYLGRVDSDNCYAVAVAVPKVFIGAGQGPAFAPTTSIGTAGTTVGDAGDASGLVNTFRQVRSSLGLGTLVAAASAAGLTTGLSVYAPSRRCRFRQTGMCRRRR